MSSTFEHQLHTFPSGLRLVTMPMKGTQTATVFVLTGAGFKYETKEQAGISHFLEHMMFKGTTRRPDKMTMATQLDSIGAEYNAFTGKEETGYYARASASKVDLLMDVVYDIFLNSLIKQEDVDVERGVIAEELRMYQDNPSRLASELLEKVLWGGQPAGWGIEEELDALPHLNHPELADYFAKQYVASNTVVAVAGAVDSAAVIAKTERDFGHIRQTKPHGKEPIREIQIAPATLIHDKKTDQTHFNIAFRSFGMYDDRRYALSLLASVLGGGMSSRLWHEVREKRGLAYYVNAGVDSLTDHGVMAISAGVNNAKAVEAVDVICREIARVREHGITAQELQRVKDQAEGGMVLGLENSRHVAGLGASSVLFRERVVTPEEELVQFKAVTLDQVAAVAADVLRDDRLNLALVGPHVEGAFHEVLSVKNS